MNMRSTTVWILLLLFTSVSFVMGEHHMTAAAILALAALKFVLVAREFMELRHAAALWSVGLFSLLALIVLSLTLMLA